MTMDRKKWEKEAHVTSAKDYGVSFTIVSFICLYRCELKRVHLYGCQRWLFH